MRGAIAVLAIIALQACGMREEPAIEHLHPNGLALRLPASLVVHQLNDGFVVQPAASVQTRAPHQVFVSLRQGVSPLAGGELERKNVAGHLVFFRVDHEEGGSGGASHKLTAWRPYADGYVLITQVAQAEWPAAPDHSLAWVVIGAIGP